MTTRNPRLEAVVSLRDEASRALKGLTAQTRKFKNEIRATGLAMTAMGGAIAALAGVVVKFASDLVESVNAVEVIFGSAAQTILDFGKTSSQMVGLANADFNQLAAVTGALFRDIGLSEEEVAQQTIELTKRASDLASVFNTPVKEALNAINAAVRGETEPIRRFSGDVTDATLKMEALSLGIKKSVEVMSEQEKRLLRVKVIMRQTADVQGDFLRTSEEFANQSRIVTAELKDQAAAMGTILLPVAKDLVGTIGTVVKKIAEWTKENPELTATLVKVAVGLGAVFLVIGPLLLVLPGLVTAISLLSGAFAVLAAAKFSVIAAGIASIGLAAATWTAIIGAVGSAILALAVSIRIAVNLVNDAINQLKGETTRFEEVGDIWEESLNDILDPIKEVGKDIQDAMTDFLSPEPIRKSAAELAVAAADFRESGGAVAEGIPGLQAFKDGMEDIGDLAEEAAKGAAKFTESIDENDMSMQGWQDQFKELEKEVVAFSGTWAARTKQIIHDRDEAFAIEPLTPFEELLSEMPGLLEAFQLGMIDATQAALILAGAVDNLGVEVAKTLDPFEQLLSEAPGLLEAFELGMIDAQQAALVLAGAVDNVSAALVEQVGEVTTLQDKWESFIKATKGADQFSGAIASQFNLGPEDTLRGPRGGGALQGPVDEALARQRRADTPGFDERGNPIPPPRNTESGEPRISIELSESLDTGMGKMTAE